MSNGEKRVNPNASHWKGYSEEDKRQYEEQFSPEPDKNKSETPKRVKGKRKKLNKEEYLALSEEDREKYDREEILGKEK